MLQFSRRGFRELPGPSTRMRGAGGLPYNPRRPLRLPRDRRPRKRPQLDPSGILRLLLPIALLVALGVGVFFGVDALLDDGDDDQAAAAVGTAPPPDLEDDAVVEPATDGTTAGQAQDTPSLPPS